MSIELTQIKHPVVFHINGYGDRLMGLPTIHALTQLFPSRLQIVGAVGDSELFYQGLDVDAIVELPLISNQERLFDEIALANCLSDCDLFISLNTWSSPSLHQLLEKLAPIPTIGLDSHFQIQLPYLPTEHYVDSLFQAVQYLEPNLTPEAFITPPICAHLDLLAAHQLQQSRQPSQKILAVHTQTETAKMWMLDRFAEVLQTFLDSYPEYLVVILDPQPTDLQKLLTHDRVSFSNDRSLGSIFALVGIADLFLGIDSCLLHAADLYGVPGIGLFGHTNPQKFGFRFTPHYHVLGSSMAEIKALTVLDLLSELARDLAHLSF